MEQPDIPTGNGTATIDANTLESIVEATPAQPAKKRTPRPKKKTAKRLKTKASGAAVSSKAKKRGAKSFPAASFEEALVLPTAIQRIGGGVHRVRRLTLFENLKKSPDSSASRGLISTSSRYGLTKGSYQAEYIELTDDGRLASSTEASPIARFRARLKLAVEDIPPFKALYDEFKDKKLPTPQVMRDCLAEAGYPRDDDLAACVDMFIVNAKFVGVLKTIAGAERLLRPEHAADELTSGEASLARVAATPPTNDGRGAAPEHDFSKVCFYITPIGDEDSEQRKHSDLFLGSIVEPALEQFGLKVVRADGIGKPGMITAQVIEHVVRSALVIADLSYRNPNVFYELCLRHTCRLPIVQIIRAADDIPFDLDQFRTIRIDTTDIYSLVPQLETYKSEIATQVRRALAEPESVDNPLTVFYPALWETTHGLAKKIAVES